MLRGRDAEISVRNSNDDVRGRTGSDALGALRFILLMLDALGSEFLYIVVSAFTLYVFLPMLVIVESIFALGYFWLRRRRVHQTPKPAAIATPERYGSGETERV